MRGNSIERNEEFYVTVYVAAKVKDRTLTVGILGLGYVGLPLFLWHAGQIFQ